MSLELPARARRLATATFVSGSLLVLGACSADDRAQIERLAMPESASAEAPVIFELWKWAWVAALITGVIVWALIGWACFRYRRRSEDEVPVQTRYNLPIEIFYTIAPIMMVIVFFYWTVDAQNKVLDGPNSDNPTRELTVVGQKWSWTFNYEDEAAVGGETVHFVGTPAEPPTLVLPVDETVRIKLRSPDVVHSFWVPAFLFKMDVVPGRDNEFTVTPDRVGTYAGKCAELCGAYHSRMLFNLDVVSAEEYDSYLQELEAQGNIGLITGPDEADTQAGLDDDTNEEDE